MTYVMTFLGLAFLLVAIPLGLMLAPLALAVFLLTIVTRRGHGYFQGPPAAPTGVA
jgi:hypothetical protein